MYEVVAVCYIIPHCGHLFRGYFTAAFCVMCAICGLNLMYWWPGLVEGGISVPVTKSLIDLRRTCTVPHVDDCAVVLLDICECCFILTVLKTCTETPVVYHAVIH